MKKTLLITVAMTVAMACLSACSNVQRVPPIQVWDDMKHQPKFKAQSGINTVLVGGAFADGRISRMAPEDTVARGQYREDTPYNTGMEGNNMYVGKMPVPMTMELLKQGQTKFNIYCSPCHDQTGMGKGIVPAHVPTWQPSNLTEMRVVQFADGDIFNVITGGRRTMPAYQYQIPIADRWAIVAYVRTLQRAAQSSMADVPAGMQVEGKQ